MTLSILKKVYLTVITTVLFTLNTSASERPSQSEMLAYLKSGATQSASCNYIPFHYIQLDSPIYIIQGVVQDSSGKGWTLGNIKAAESQVLISVFQKLPMFTIIQADDVQLWFQPVPGTSKNDLIFGLYQVKKAIDNHSASLYITSQRICPGGVSVNNF